jgi:RING finger protein 113A
MSDLIENPNIGDLTVKKRKKKRNVEIEPSFDTGTSLVDSILSEENDNLSTAPPNANKNDQDDDNSDSQPSTYTKKRRMNANGINLDDPLVQLQSKSDRDKSVIGHETHLESKKIQDDIEKNLEHHKKSMVAKFGVQSTMDHKADLCKDYFQFGFCRWGDECIFVHDRSEWKSGNQLDQEYQKSVAQGKLDEENIKILKVPEEDKLPLLCSLCGKDFPKLDDFNIDKKSSLDTSGSLPADTQTRLNGMVHTVCKHFFHKNCAMQRFAQGNHSCEICGTETKGRFTPALSEMTRRAQQTTLWMKKHAEKLAKWEEDKKFGDRKALLKGRY